MYNNIDYLFGTAIVYDTSELFEKAFLHYLQFAACHDSTAHMIHISCWNRRLEGSYPEPSLESGYARLEALKKNVEERKSGF